MVRIHQVHLATVKMKLNKLTDLMIFMIYSL